MKLTKFIKKSVEGALILTGITFFSSIPTMAATFNAADDFSPTNNNGTWQYGYSTALDGTFNSYTNNTSFYNIPELQVWRTPGLNEYLNVVHNPTANNLLSSLNRTQEWLPGQLTFHPGINGEYSIVRWIPPETNDYSLVSSFVGADINGATSDVHILRNGTSIFDTLVEGFGASSTKSFSTSFSLNAGDTIDFAVGVGTNNNYAYDMTGIDVTIESAENVPEPITILGSATALGFGALFKKKKLSSKTQ